MMAPIEPHARIAERMPAPLTAVCILRPQGGESSRFAQHGLRRVESIFPCQVERLRDLIQQIFATMIRIFS